jgi:hypothetical protein
MSQDPIVQYALIGVPVEVERLRRNLCSATWRQSKLKAAHKRGWFTLKSVCRKRPPLSSDYPIPKRGEMATPKRIAILTDFPAI